MNTEHETPRLPGMPPPAPSIHPINEHTAAAINAACKIIHDWAISKGWWDQPRHKGELIALIHSELSECLEYLRTPSKCPKCGKPMKREQLPNGLGGWDCTPCKVYLNDFHAMDDKCPDLTGEAAELADTVIRILDYAGAYGIDLGNAIARKHAYNMGREQKHGGKRF